MHGIRGFYYVSLTLCCFVVCSAGRFVLCPTLCRFVLVFFSPFSACLSLSVSSSSWCLGEAAVCDCGVTGGSRGAHFSLYLSVRFTVLFFFFFFFFFGGGGGGGGVVCVCFFSKVGRGA